MAVHLFFFSETGKLYSSALRYAGHLQKRKQLQTSYQLYNIIYISIQSCLHQKSRDTIQFHCTLCMALDLSSKHFPFLSFDIDRHIRDGINFHHLFWLLLPPLLIQQLKRSDVWSCIIQLVLVMLRKRFHNWVVAVHLIYDLFGISFLEISLRFSLSILIRKNFN